MVLHVGFVQTIQNEVLRVERFYVIIITLSKNFVYSSKGQRLFDGNRLSGKKECIYTNFIYRTFLRLIIKCIMKNKIDEIILVFSIMHGMFHRN